MDHKIGIIPHSRPTLGIEEERAVVDVIRSGNIAQGKKVLQFESAMSIFLGRKYGVAVSSGIASLHLALLALKVKEGDEVILPSYTCDALLNAVLYLHATPVIVDVDYSDGNLSYKAVRDSITNMTRAIIVPHSFGFPADIDKILDLGIPVIEDCAVAIGARYKGRNVGSFGSISVCSFYATKMLTTGEGGMILTDDIDMAEYVRELRDYSGHMDFKVRYNYKMTDIAAAMGIEQLLKIERFIKMRKKLADNYTHYLSGNENIILPSSADYGIPVFYRYIVKVLCCDTNAIRNRISEFNIFCGMAVLQPLHRLLGLPPKNYENSERLLRENISLPIYPSLHEDEVEYIARKFIETIKELSNNRNPSA